MHHILDYPKFDAACLLLDKILVVVHRYAAPPPLISDLTNSHSAPIFTLVAQPHTIFLFSVLLENKGLV
jgi:hypothetical protein